MYGGRPPAGGLPLFHRAAGSGSGRCGATPVTNPVSVGRMAPLSAVTRNSSATILPAGSENSLTLSERSSSFASASRYATKVAPGRGRRG